MSDEENDGQKIVVNEIPKTIEGMRLRCLELAAEQAEQKTRRLGQVYTADDLIHAARKYYLFIERGL